MKKLISAVLVVFMAFSGFSADAYARQNSLFENYGDTVHEVNGFLNNFIEAFLWDYNMDTRPASLVFFAFRHNYQNNFELFETTAIGGNHYYAIDGLVISDTIERFFGLEINLESTPSFDNSQYEDGIFYANTVDGEDLFNARTQSIWVNGDGSGQMMVFFHIYGFDPKNDEEAANPEYEGVAVIENAVYNGEDTFRLISLVTYPYVYTATEDKLLLPVGCISRNLLPEDGRTWTMTAEYSFQIDLDQDTGGVLNEMAVSGIHILRDIINSVVGNTGFDEITGPDGLEQLKEQVLELVNRRFNTNLITGMFITDAVYAPVH